MSETEFTIGRHCGVTFAGLKIASLVSLARGEEDVIACLSRRFANKEGLPSAFFARMRSACSYISATEIDWKSICPCQKSGHSLLVSGMTTHRLKRRWNN